MPKFASQSPWFVLAFFLGALLSHVREALQISGHESLPHKFDSQTSQSSALLNWWKRYSTMYGISADSRSEKSITWFSSMPKSGRITDRCKNLLILLPMNILNVYLHDLLLQSFGRTHPQCPRHAFVFFAGQGTDLDTSSSPNGSFFHGIPPNCPDWCCAFVGS